MFHHSNVKSHQYSKDSALYFKSQEGCWLSPLWRGSIFCPLWDARHSQTLFANDQEHLCTRTLKAPVAIPKMPLGTSASELWSSLLGIQKSFSELCLDPGRLASCVVARNSSGHPCGRHARKPSPELLIGNLVETLGLTRFPPDAF